MLALPPLTYYMWICVSEFGGALVVPTAEMLSRVPAPTLVAVALYLGWFLLHVLLQLAVPGPIAQGVYKLNGWWSFWITLAVVVLAVLAGWIPATILHDQFGPLLTTVNIFAFAFSVFLYRLGQPSDGLLYDYFLGTVLNPRTHGLDWKFFCESRPGLILWVLMNLSLAAKQQQLHGALTTPMILVVAFQFLYIADYFFHEEAILSTWDIRHEKFGWMLCWGDLGWVPFTYTLQAFYLVHHPHDLPPWATVAIVALNLTGYWIFRRANIQKHRFRKNPDAPIWGKAPDYIRTAAGSPLLVSGWWGLSRHMNYFGDLLMALAWCLPAGFEHPLPYFYMVYFTILLVHRERRDHAACRAKYGDDWEAYCARVRWRIIPGVY